MLIPPFSRLSAFAVIILQTLRGLLLGIPVPCVTILVVNWSPKTERGFLCSLIQPAYELGPALGNMFSGYISESPAGWPYAFYSVGTLGLLLSVYVSFFTAENPREHRGISKAELNFILCQQENKLLRKNGLFSAAPFFLAALTAFIASCISSFIEKAKVVSVDFLRKFWQFISCTLYSLCLLGIYIAGCNRNLSVVFSILSMGFFGMSIPGVYIVVQDMSPTFSGTLHAMGSTVGYFACVILPVIVGYLTGEMQTLEQWNKIFFISIGVVMSSAIIFVVFGSAETQSWNFADAEVVEAAEKKWSENNTNKENARF